MQNKLRIIVQPRFYMVISLALLIIPLRWLISWAFAAAVHELFHYIALRIFKNQIHAMHIGTSGLKMQTGILTNREEVICAVAGPVGSMILVWLAKWMPTVGICAFVQLAYNLLPLRNFDGGRVCLVLLRKILGYTKGEKAFTVTEKTVMLILSAVSILLLFRSFLGLVLLLNLLFFLYRMRKGKYTCKDSQLRVQ